MDPHGHTHHHKPLPSRAAFARRLAGYGLVALAVIAGSLGIGMVGYHAIAGLSWVDAFLNAAMILSGMGPVNPLPTDAAKVFAGGYALFSGIVFITTAGVLLAPVLHRFLHRLHLEIAPAAPDEPRPASQKTEKSMSNIEYGTKK